MKPTARTCHATRILLELAHHGHQSPMRASVLSVTIGISIKLLEKIIRPLKGAGLLKSVRGATGGYILGRDPSLITLADVLTTMEGAVFKPQCCESDTDCLLMEGCPTGSVWVDIARHMEMKFRATTLADFMNGPADTCPSRKARTDRAARVAREQTPDTAPEKTGDHAQAKGRGRVARRRKPGSATPAFRPAGRPRLV
ncbi:MAG: Rrf2 family transcriptional regulator [Desulfovibrio sp.]|jgi:Rrf2 family protein|nr:Rrf2 family transcriptional regulator [Desulfovibrio sp.]